MIERYGVYWVNLDPVRGNEISKTRPAVVISDQDMNQVLNTVVVCPVTSKLHPQWPTRIQTTIGGAPAEVAVDQIRTIDKFRLKAQIDSLDSIAAEEVRHVVTQMYGVLSL